MKRNVYLTICVFLAIILVSSPVFAVSADDVINTSGATVNDINSNLTEVQTDAVDNLKAEVNWSKLNIDSGETLHNVFNGQNQTLVHRVLGSDLSQINGKITSAGVGNDTSKMILINPNGVYFNGAEVNVPSLVVSTINDVKITCSQAKFRNENNNNSYIYALNSTFETPYGASFVSASTIYMNNTNIHSSNGNIQMVTADGVNFKFKNNIAKKASNITADKDDSKTYKYTYINNSDIRADQGDIYVHSKTNSQGTSYINLIANKAIKAPNGTVYFLSENSDPEGGSHFYSSNNPEIESNKTAVKAKDVIVYDNLKTSNNLDIKAETLSSYYSYIKEIYEENFPHLVSLLDNYPRAELVAGGKMNINVNFLKMEDSKIESTNNLIFTADKLLAEGVEFKSGKTVKLTLKDQDIALESYDNSQNRVVLSYDNDANNEFYISNPNNRQINLNVSENNTIAINNLIDKISPFILKAGYIATSNNGTIANKRTVNITALNEDISIDSYNSATDELNVKFGDDILKIQNKKAKIALATSEDNSLTIQGIINKNSAFALAAGEFNIGDGAGLETSKKVSITDKAGDLNLISSESEGTEGFTDVNDNFLAVDTDALTGRLDPEQLGTGRLEITAENGNINLYNNFDREISKLNTNKDFSINEFEPAPMPSAVVQLVLASTNLADESIQTTKITNSNIPNALFGNEPNFNSFGGASAGINSQDNSNKFAGVLCDKKDGCNGNIEYYKVLEPLLYNN